MEYHSRKEHRLKNYDYSRNGAYFITICSKDKHHYFWDYHKRVGGDAHIAPPSINDVADISAPIPFELSDIGNVIDKYLKNINGICKYVIMPNHIHMIIVIDDHMCGFEEGGAMWASPPTQSLSQRIRSFKTLATKELGFSPWQRNYYDRIIRNAGEYRAYCRYIESNPHQWENDEYFIKE